MIAKIIETVKKNRALQVVLAILVVALAYAAWVYHEKAEQTTEGLENVEEPALVQAEPALDLAADVVPATQEQQQVDTIVAGKDQLTAEELLPKYDEADAFAEQNPVAKLLKEQNFLISGYHMGINTVVQSNKIKYHDLRSAPPVAKKEVSPFLNSSYDSPMGSGRRQLEIA